MTFFKVLYINPYPKEKEKEAETHEWRCNNGNYQFLHQSSSFLGRRDLVNGKPCSKENSNSHQNQSQVRKNCWVNGWHVSRHGLDINLKIGKFVKITPSISNSVDHVEFLTPYHFDWLFDKLQLECSVRRVFQTQSSQKDDPVDS